MTSAEPKTSPTRMFGTGRLLLAWEVDGEDRDLVDQIAVEISYVKDDASDEDLFRVRVADLIVPEVSQAAL